MITPDCETIMELAPRYNTVPICKEVYADIVTPITMLRRLAERSDHYFLLESIEGGEKWGRYSFLGFDPVKKVCCRDGIVRIEGKEIREVRKAKPLEVLRELLAEYKVPEIEGIPPFTGGFVGYFGYSMIGYAEPKLILKKDSFQDYEMMLFDKVIAYDHLKQKISIIVNMKTDKIMENYGNAISQLEAIAAVIRENTPLPKLKSDKRVRFQCNVSKEEYIRLVEKTKEYIKEGDIFQAVISRRFFSEYQGSLINAYRVLRTTNPSPYMVYLHFGEEEIISTSPETLVRLEKKRLFTFPVAGSRPRGKTEEEDNALEEGLLKDEKELAEHNMLVDLGRNDLGKISKFGSVEVTKYQMIHKYSKIMHICSQVEGTIREDADCCDAIEAVLPAGTLSGAPKIRACEIIEELEPEPRGIYGGALGYMDFSGNLDTCIAIRMAVKKDNQVYVQAGGGIVADSVPELEYEESANKAMAVMNAIQNAGEVEEI